MPPSGYWRRCSCSVGVSLQGFSAGMQLGAVSVYLSEIAPPGRKGFYVSWQSVSQQAAVVFAALIGIGLTATLSPAAISRWGWRVPLLVGVPIIPLLHRLCGSLQETDESLASRRHTTIADVLRALAANARLVLIGTLMVTMTTVSFYMITAYTPTFGNSVLKLSSFASLTVTLWVGLSNLIWLPTMGALSDRIGRRPLLIACTLLMLTSAYPAMLWLVERPSFSRLLAVQLWFSFIFGSYNGAMVPFLTEIMPVNLRTTGFSLAYSLSAGVFGGFTPAISTYLIHITGNRAIPGVWLSFAAGCGLIAAMLARSQPREAAAHIIDAGTGVAPNHTLVPERDVPLTRWLDRRKTFRS